MRQKFFTDTIQSRFIKALLYDMYLPKCNCVSEGDYLVQDSIYVFKNNIIQCTESGYLGTDAKYYDVLDYTFGNVYPKYTNNFNSPYIYYDSDTHERLGKLVECLNKIYDLDLRPFYNCFSGRYTNDFYLKPEVFRTDVNQSFIQDNISESKFYGDINGSEIKNLIVDFEPKQYGSGTPSSENIRSIIKYDNITLQNINYNIWNEVWTQGSINASTGANMNSSNQIRSGYIPIKPNVTYSCNISVLFCFYELDKTFISSESSSKTVVSPSNCSYLRFRTTTSYGGTYKNDISITEGTNTENYYPYILSKNYYNSMNDTEGYYYDDNLDYVSNASSILTDFISTYTNKKLIIQISKRTVQSFLRVNFFESKEDEKPFSQIKQEQLYFTEDPPISVYEIDIPNNAKYFRISRNNTSFLRGITFKENYPQSYDIAFYKWESGTFNYQTGENSDILGRIRTSYIPIQDQTVSISYRKKPGSNSGMIRWFYTSDINNPTGEGVIYGGNTGSFPSAANGTYNISNIPSGAKYIKIALGNSTVPVTLDFNPEGWLKINTNTICGGSFNFKTGELKYTYGYIDQYDGENIPGKWLSDRDEYVEGATPTEGAEVIYELEEPIVFQAFPFKLKSTPYGENLLYSISGNIESIEIDNIDKYTNIEVNGNKWKSMNPSYGLTKFIRSNEEWNMIKGENLIPVSLYNYGITYDLQEGQTPAEGDMLSVNYIESEMEIVNHISKNYKVAMVPIKYNKEYTIALDCDSEVNMFPIICSNRELLKVTLSGEQTDLTEKLYLYTSDIIRKYNGMNFKQPIIYYIENKNETEVANRPINSILQQYEEDLYLLIQYTNTNNSSLVVLEGNYKNTGSRKIFNMEEIDSISDKELNNILLSNLSLLQFSDRVRYPFADRLIEYLLLNVITNRDDITNDIKRVQEDLGIINNGKVQKDIWNKYLRAYLYKYYMENPKTSGLDINGFVDKDVEFFISKEGR